VYQCRGICQTGTRTCTDGRLTGTCEGQITQAIAERCGESPAVDDNCDGAIDEGCPCEPGATQPCYTGPVGTRDVGRCADGIQTCRSLLGYTSWGRCLNDAVPEVEMCETVGEDDDCDGDSDDIDVEGETCLTGERGICAFGVARCEDAVTECERLRDPVVETCNGADDDCDGASDEDYDLDSNRNRCGSCTNRCSSSQDCCDGGCVDINNDEQNCGACGRPCASGETCVNGQCDCGGENSYCNGTCRSASWFSNNNDNCGRCNNRCTGDQVCIGTACQLP
jgi:hypothetical protein